MMKIDLLLLACLAALASCETFKTFKSDNGYQSYKSDGSDACEVFTKFHYSWSFDFENLPKYLADTVEMTVSNLWPNTPALKPFVGKKMTRDEVANWCALIGASSAWYRLDYDCLGYGNKGLGDMHTLIFNERLGTEGVVNVPFLTRFETNDKGQLTKMAFHDYNGRIPYPDQETSFVLIDGNAECDLSAGEVFKQKALGKVSLEKCQSLCKSEPECKSITYFNSGYCTLFSTACTKYKFKSKAISQFKLVAPKGPLADMWRVVAPKVTGPDRVFKEVGFNNECDRAAGEVFLISSPGADTSFDKCKQSCKDNQECQSLTYFKGGYCSHFSTPCTSTKVKSKAISLRFVSPVTSPPKTSTRRLRRA